VSGDWAHPNDIFRSDAAEFGREVDREELSILSDEDFDSVYQKLLSPKCADLYGTPESRENGWDPATIFRNLFAGHGGFGEVKFGPTLGALALTSPSFGSKGITAIVNLNIDAWTGKLVHDTFERSLTLLHELGHAYNLLSLRGSGGSKIVQFDLLPGRNDANDRLVIENCLTIGPRSGQ
jgi:hypothetical protein